MTTGDPFLDSSPLWRRVFRAVVRLIEHAFNNASVDARNIRGVIPIDNLPGIPPAGTPPPDPIDPPPYDPPPSDDDPPDPPPTPPPPTGGLYPPWEATPTRIGGIALAGDIGGTAAVPMAVGIQGTRISTEPRVHRDLLVYDKPTDRWILMRWEELVNEIVPPPALIWDGAGLTWNGNFITWGS